MKYLIHFQVEQYISGGNMSGCILNKSKLLCILWGVLHDYIS